MIRTRIIFAIAGTMFAAASITRGQAPVIANIQPNPANPSSRLRIDGDGFGALQEDRQIVVNASPAFVTQWTDDTIIAYVPESTPTGTATVKIIVGGQVADEFPIMILTRQPQGQMKWRFAVDASYITHRPGIGPDGSVYLNDAQGRLYKLDANGGLKWIVDALRGQVGSGANGPTVVGSDGTIYVTVNPLGPTTDLVAYNPDGSLRWVFVDPNSLGVAVGPAVGPDENVYVAFHDLDSDSFGITSLTPAGEYRWNNNGSPPLYEHGAIGAELSFGRSTEDGLIDQVVLTVGGDFEGFLYAFDISDGGQNWVTPRGVVEGVFLQFQMQAETGPDGTAYMTEFTGLGGLGWGLKAFNRATGVELWRWDPGINSEFSAPHAGSNGTIYASWDISRVSAISPTGGTLWTHVDFGGIKTGPIVSPDNQVVITGGGLFGQPGFFKAIDASTGAELWKHNLTVENGGPIITDARARFTPDSGTAYFPASIPASPQAFRYCYLYALEVEAVISDLDGDGVADGDDNCPNVANPDQSDADGDGLGDACDGNSDLCVSAVSICPGTIVGSTFGATNDGLSTCSPFANLNKDVWFSYTPQSGGTAVIDTCNSAYSNYLSVHSGCPGTTANQIACAASGCGLFPRVVLNVNAGTTYLIRINGYAANEITFTLTLSGPACGMAAVPGDIDGDGDVDVADRNLFAAVLVGMDADPSHIARSDVNGDGAANGRDIQPMVAALLGG